VVAGEKISISLIWDFTGLTASDFTDVVGGTEDLVEAAGKVEKISISEKLALG